MRSDEELIEWLKKFDVSKYSVQVYQELVIESQEHLDRLSIMGAWKTGALRQSTAGNAYVNTLGGIYKFTDRWKPGAPVGYGVWQDISANQQSVKARIPNQFTVEQPKIVAELIARSGFGPIWALFVLHCFYPEVYPLYDQHVYRAYVYLTINGSLKPRPTPGKWSVYADYRQFFLQKMAITRLRYWELDRALWALGKSVKTK